MYDFSTNTPKIQDSEDGIPNSSIAKTNKSINPNKAILSDDTSKILIFHNVTCFFSGLKLLSGIMT